MIYTVNGPIESSELGFTTMHEHLHCNVSDLLGPIVQMYAKQIPKESLDLTQENLANLRSGMSVFSSACGTAGDIDYAVNEYKAFKNMGGKAIVDATPLGGRGDIDEMKEASQKSGVHIVACTGLYVAASQPEHLKVMDEDELVEYFKNEVVQGMDGTRIRAGFVKCAINTLNENKIDPLEIKSVRACARVSAATGCSMHMHSAFPLTESHIIEVAEMILALGVDPKKLVMLHMDSFIRIPRTHMDYVQNFEVKKSVNIDLQLALLSKGINIGFDAWDSLTTTLPDNWDRLKALIELLKRGYGDQIVLGHDITDKSRGVAYGYTGFTGFMRNAIPMLEELGFEDEILKMTIETPARILDF